MWGVDLREEQLDGCVGKYTIGLGQEKMAFMEDNEDIQSLALTGKQDRVTMHMAGTSDAPQR